MFKSLHKMYLLADDFQNNLFSFLLPSFRGTKTYKALLWPTNNLEKAALETFFVSFFLNRMS